MEKTTTQIDTQVDRVLTEGDLIKRAFVKTMQAMQRKYHHHQ